MKLILLVLTVCTGIISCKKNTPDFSSFWQCNNSQNLDSTSITDKLLGSWTWTEQSCYWTGKTTKADKDIKVTFNSNTTFTVRENSAIISQSNWKLKIVDSNMWGLDLTTPSLYLYGRLLFCNNQVLFNDSYRDGCDNLFVK